MNYKFRGPNLQIYLFIYLLQNSYLEKTGTDWGIFKAFIFGSVWQTWTKCQNIAKFG